MPVSALAVGSSAAWRNAQSCKPDTHVQGAAGGWIVYDVLALLLFCLSCICTAPAAVCAGEGLITYMRTDGVNLSAEAVESLRDLIGSLYGASYLPPAGLRVYKSRAKNAQEAHEAIRPTNPALLPGQVQGLTSDQVRG
jgi:reverse gyrase